MLLWVSLGSVALAGELEVEPLVQLEAGSPQWVTSSPPGWPEGAVVPEGEPAVRCDALLGMDRKTGEIVTVQVQGCPDPFLEATSAALDGWQAKVAADARQGVVGVRVGVSFVGDLAWVGPVGRTPVEVRVLQEAQTTCVVELEVTAAGRATVIASTRPGCLELPRGNQWTGPVPNTGRCTVIATSPVEVVSCEPKALTPRVGPVLDERLAIPAGWGERRVEVTFAAPVRAGAEVPLEAAERVAVPWEEAWVEEPPVPQVDCTVELVIGTDGAPEDVRVWTCREPYAGRVADTVAQWRWMPPKVDGVPARVWTTLPVRMQLESTLPVAIPLPAYARLRAETGWVLDAVDESDCVAEMTVAEDAVTNLAVNRIPECLVAPAVPNLKKWRKKASGPASCTFRVEASDARPTLLSVSDCPAEVQAALEGGALDGWSFNGGPDPQRYEVTWALRP